MAGDSEKRFHSIMDKLFHPPNPIPSSSSCSRGEPRSGVKRRNADSALALVDPKLSSNLVENCQLSSIGSTEAPLCRPWDRGDLMRRLATFKSMTWFAKPKVVSAVNCARRGWVNVETDTITCESCKSRLLFSTPSSWSRHQVEKAALVFSLKLDNGHKLLCPWLDNSCDETLAQFPPTPPPVLVDKFRERSSKLVEMLALPLVSSSSTENIRNPQLEEFLKQSLVFEHGNGSLVASQSDALDNGADHQSVKLYYQALNLISLCGWEPRSLPYVVEREDSFDHNETMEAPEHSGDLKSVVLDCRLCGASVGLWTFHKVSRPVEFFRLVGPTEVGGRGNAESQASGSENHDNGEVVNTASNIAPLSKDNSSGLNLTIAGGPPPTKQNFKATISIPIVGRALRARFSNDSDFKGWTYNHHEEIQSSSAINKILSLGEKECEEGNVFQQIAQTDTSLLNSQQSEDSLCSNPDVCGQALTIQNTGASQNDGLSENARNVDSITSAEEIIISSANNDISAGTTHPSFTIVNGDQSDTERSLVVASNNAETRIAGKDLECQLEDNRMRFDPIRQHRHFCPWITSTSSGPPGWQQTLTALQRKRDPSQSSPTNSSPSTSIIKVDDPITSVRKLFTSPVTKRLKSQGSM